MNLLELDFRELFPSLYAKGKEKLNRLEGLLAIKDRELKDVGTKLDRLIALLLERPDSAALLESLDMLERQKAELSKDVEGLRFQIVEEKERLAGAGKAYGDVGDALKRFIEIEQLTHALEQKHRGNGPAEDAPEELMAAREERLTVRRRIYQLLQKSVEKIIFTPATTGEDGDADQTREAEFGTITISFKGLGESASVSVVVIGKRQKDSRGYVGEPTGNTPPHVTLVDETWPPTGRILSSKGLERILFRRNLQS